MKVSYPDRRMVANCSMKTSPKTIDRRWGVEEEEVTFTSTVGSAKPSHWDRATGSFTQERRPQMFPALGVVRVPDFADLETPPQVVHVPVGAPGKAQVMAHSPAQSAGTEGGANVHIGSRADGEQTEPADLDDTATRGAKDQCICSRLGANRRKKGN
jgi:hypothetical protein